MIATATWEKQFREGATVTEQDWLKAKTIIDLDLWRSAKTQHRKWRLFAVACSRRAMGLVNDARLEPVAEAAERFADGEITWEQVKQARKVFVAVRREVGDPFGPNEALRHTLEALDAATGNKPASTLWTPHKAEAAFSYLKRLDISDHQARIRDFKRREAAEEKQQLRLARCIFGNPFRLVAFADSWRSETAVALAAGIYAERAFDRLPILADALEEAGCDHPDILAHCRGPGPHARGCWVVDLVLGKK